MRFRIRLAGMLIAAAVVGTSPAAESKVQGVVRDAAGPVEGAVVRIQGISLHAITDAQGRFTLGTGAFHEPLSLTAFAPGYFIAGPVTAGSGNADISITLQRHTQRDHASYEWVSAFSSAGDPVNCELCHSAPSPFGGELPFDEWSQDAHATSASNPRFLSMYNGSGPDGRPHVGPGYRLDFPESSGNCATCHAPNAAVHCPLGTDPNRVTGVGKEGVGCDFCHKIWAVRLNPATGLPFPNAPGVLSLEFRRPPQGDQLFLGPRDDVAGRDSCSPLQKQSAICAPCHYGQFWGVDIYNSFGEWLASPYSHPVNGRTCQDCHMPRRGATHTARGETGALARDPQTIFSHLMPGAADIDLLRDTAVLALEAVREGGVLHVEAMVFNANGGHHIPTDHPARNMLLVLSATDAAGTPLPLLRGPLVPGWGGKGEEADDYAGRPGRGYGKILRELRTGFLPTAAYWNPVELVEDTRIPALGRDVSRYEFAIPPGSGLLRVRSRLIFRRAFKALARQKGWDDADILMEQAETVVR
jgi:hypothetical protein